VTGLVVPAYFHPALYPDDWALLARRAEQIRLVVLNLANGPGTRPDDAFLPALAKLKDAGITVVGYVDTDYGRRDIGSALLEVNRYVDWYGVTGALFDRVSAGADELGHYAKLAARTRAIGLGTVAFNHGAHPFEGYVEHADLLGTFEGPWSAYLDAGIPRWIRSLPAERFYHLVFSVPRRYLGEALALARRRNAANAFVTNHGGSNPWRRLPDDEWTSGTP